MVEITAVSAVLTAVVAVSAVTWYVKREKKKTPPGPWGYPVVGNLAKFIEVIQNNTFPQYIAGLHEEYGKIISFNTGALTMIFIKDGALIKKLFSSEDFAERPVDALTVVKKLVKGKFGGVFFHNGASQQEMRKFSLAAFRDFGVGRKSLDESMQSEFAQFCAYLDDVAYNRDGIVRDLRKRSQQCAANVVHDIIFGFRYDYEDETWNDFLEQLRVNLLGFAENYFPILTYFPFLNDLISGDREKKYYLANDFLYDYVNRQIQEHKATFYDGEIRDFIDLYIKYERENKDFYNQQNIFMTIMDLIRLGSDTVSTAMARSMQYLTQMPELQEELRKEIDEAIGQRVFERRDQDKLVKTNAFLFEVLRYASVSPFAAPHTVYQPTTIEGFTFPPNCLVFSSIYAIHHDKEYWGDPECFRIGRWIDENNKLLRHEGFFQPWNVGKRVCVGRQLSHIELQLFIVEILQKFRFEPADGYADPFYNHGPGHMSNLQFNFKVVRRS